MTKHCKECGGEYRSRQYNAEFCGNECRRTFNNRRAQRGAVLLDMAMIIEFSPSASNLATAMQERMKEALRQWRQEDEAERAGRKSWKRENEVMIDTVRFAGERL